jgi:hypothetical protein
MALFLLMIGKKQDIDNSPSRKESGQPGLQLDCASAETSCAEEHSTATVEKV